MSEEKKPKNLDLREKPLIDVNLESGEAGLVNPELSGKDIAEIQAGLRPDTAGTGIDRFNILSQKSGINHDLTPAPEPDKVLGIVPDTLGELAKINQATANLLNGDNNLGGGPGAVHAAHEMMNLANGAEEPNQEDPVSSLNNLLS